MTSPVEVTSPPLSEAHVLHKPVFGVFLCVFAVSLSALFLRIQAPALEAFFVISAAATMITGLGRRLPAQNVVASTALIAVLSSIATFVSAKTAIPFGPRMFTESFGPRIFGTLPWATPLIWLLAIISSRGVARLIVRPWRKTNYYGFWVIGLTILFALVLDLGLEPYAVTPRHFWIWQTSASVPSWYGAPWTNFLAWAVLALGILMLATPWLINKNPIKQPTDYHPLIVWGLLNLYFVSANAMQAHWSAVIVCAAALVLATVFAVRGARW